MSVWTKEVEKALIDREMSHKDLGEVVGLHPAYLAGIISGRLISGAARKRINGALGLEGFPAFVPPVNEKTSEWEKAVRKAVIDRNMTYEELASSIELSRTYMAGVISCRVDSPKARKRINEFLGIDENLSTAFEVT